jgi:hypothetical protein
MVSQGIPRNFVRFSTREEQIFFPGPVLFDYNGRMRSDVTGTLISDGHLRHITASAAKNRTQHNGGNAANASYNNRVFRCK